MGKVWSSDTSDIPERTNYTKWELNKTYCYNIRTIYTEHEGINEIQNAIFEALKIEGINLILTSGGTGFAPRDVTPEAVSLILTRRADSLN